MEKNFFESMYDISPGGWSYSYAAGYLKGLIEQYLRGTATRTQFTAHFAVYDVYRSAYVEMTSTDGMTSASAMAELVHRRPAAVEGSPTPTVGARPSPDA